MLKYFDDIRICKNIYFSKIFVFAKFALGSLKIYEILHFRDNETCIFVSTLFFEYLKAPIADLFTMLSSSVQNSERRGDGDGGHSCADPCQEFKEGFLGVSSGLPLD